MKFLNWMIDTVYDLFEYLIMLAVVTIAIFIIFGDWTAYSVVLYL